MKRKSAAAVGLASIAVLALAACSSSGNKDGEASSSSPAAPTTPSLQQPAIKFGIVGSFSGSGGSFGNPEPEVKSAALAAINAINQRGGIAGHEVQLVACDEQGDPNKSAACGRSLVSAGVIATVGDQSDNGARYDPILQKAGIPRIAPLPLQEEYTATNDFLDQGGALSEFIGSMKHAKAAGKKDAYVFGEGAPGMSAEIQLLQMEASKIGLQWKGSSSVPIEAADVSSYVQAAKSSGTDFALMALDKNLSFQILQASQQLGAKYAIGAPAEVPTKDMWDKLGGTSSILNGALLASSFPPVTDTSDYPAIAQFNKELDAEAATGDKHADDNRNTTFQTWMAFHVVDQVLSGATAVPTAASLKSAFEAAKDVDMGISVKWTPSAKGALIPTLSNPYGFFVTMKDGAEVLSNGPEAVDFLSDVSTG